MPTAFYRALPLLFLIAGSADAARLRLPYEDLSEMDQGKRVGIEMEYRFPEGTENVMVKSLKLANRSARGVIKISLDQIKANIKNPVTGIIAENVNFTRFRGRIERPQEAGPNELFIKVEEELNDKEGFIIDEPPDNRPLELISIPLYLREVPLMQRIADTLKSKGAIGTTENDALSLQVNVEIARGVREHVNADVITETFRAYYSPEYQRQLRKVVPVPEIRRAYIQPPSDGLIQRHFDLQYNPTLRELYDDHMYRQMWELMGNSNAWTLPIEAVQMRVMDVLYSTPEKDLPQAYFRVVKFSPIKFASLFIWLFPDDPLSQYIVKTEWIKPLPIFEFREWNNDFNIQAAVRRSVGLVNHARIKAMKKRCLIAITSPQQLPKASGD